MMESADDGILEVILNRIDLMTVEQLRKLNLILDYLEQHPSDPAAGEAPISEAR